jgi:hypothetical protein
MTEKEPQIELEINPSAGVVNLVVEVQKNIAKAHENIVVKVEDNIVVKVEDNISQAQDKITQAQDKITQVQDNVEKVILVDHVDKIGSLLMDNNYIQGLITKLSIVIDTATNAKIGNILTFLNTSVAGVLPLQSMLGNLQQVFEDGVLDLYDVPIIVKIITDLLNTNINAELLRNVKITDVGLVLKLLIYILIEFKIIQTDKIDNKTIFKIIDSSLNLLETSLKVSNIKFNCSCCPWFKK